MTRIAQLQAVAIVMLLGAAPSAPTCELYWRDLTGYGWEEQLSLAQTWPLLHFAGNAPSWWPHEYDAHGRYSKEGSRSELRWTPVDPLATVDTAGSIEEHRLYSITYAPQHQVLVWERADGSFCPFALLEGDETVVAAISKPSILSWRGKEVLSLRIFYSGNGALQDSVFFTMNDGELVHLRDEGDLLDFIQSHPITVHYRGGGFCEGALIWQNWAGHDDDQARSGATILRAVYRIDGARLVLESAALVPSETETTPCVTHPPAGRRPE